MIVPKKTSVHAQDEVQEENSDSTASRTAPVPSESTALLPLSAHSGREDDDYISGHNLFAALFGIVSVFFIVLLDFSITATVSKNSPQEHCVPRVLGRYD